MRRPIIGADPAGDGAVSSSGDLPDVDAFTWLPLVGDLEAYKDGHLDHLAAEIYVEMNTELKAEGLADGVAPELAYEATVCIEAASRLERDRSALRMASHKPRRLADRELYAARAAAAERAARQARDVRLGARVVAIPIGAGPGVPRGTHFRLALVALSKKAKSISRGRLTTARRKVFSSSASLSRIRS